MGYFRIFFLIVLYFFVTVGDFVSQVLSLLKQSLLDLRKISNYQFHTSLPEISVRKPKAKVRFSKVSVASYLRRVFRNTLFVAHAVGHEVILFLRFVLDGVTIVFVLLAYPFRKFFGRRSEGNVPVSLWKTKTFYFFIGTLFSFFFFFLPILFMIFISDLPNPTQLSSASIPKTTKIYDRRGALLYEIYVNQNRTLVPLSSVPEELVQATIAIEDKDFYSHPGFDVRGIARAAYENSTTREIQGGSTITQQLIKSALLTPEPTVSRKVKELALAFWAERIYSKDEILEMYFNYVPYGGTAWGISAASETYFGKDVQDLTLGESAFLAGLPKAPSIYSPFVGDRDSWRARQKAVLDAMVREGYITLAERDAAYSENLVFQPDRTPLLAPHFVMYVRDLLIKKYGIGAVERGGLQVTTTLDLSTQNAAEMVVESEIEASAALGISNGAALVTDPSKGEVLAMVGSRDYFDSERDGNVNVTRMRRQPGSTIKLVTYALALEHGYTEASVLNDTPISIEQQGGPAYRPVNYDGQFHGRVPLRIALANSYNIPAVRIAQDLGPEGIVSLGQDMGIESWNNIQNYGLSITLGGSEVTMLDLATVYGTVANSGRRITLDPILEVKDSTGRTVYAKDSEGEQVIEASTAYILSDILADNEARSRAFGTSSPLSIPPYRVSVKTGTTDAKRDNWTIGFTPNRLVAVWVGNNDNTPMSPTLTSGISGAAPIWHKIMSEQLLNAPVATSSLPPDVVVKDCFGKKIYLSVATQNNVRCGEGGDKIGPVREGRWGGANYFN